MTKILRHKIIQDILFGVLFLIVLILSVSRINYGFGGYDEPFYLTIPHRLSMGDALFKDEWDLAQMAGFLLFPLVKMYIRINGGTLGIVLAFRWMYLIFHSLVSVFSYIRFRKYGLFAAIGCAFYFFYIPYNIAAFSYNTMALDFLVLSAVFLSTFDIRKPIYSVLAGLCFAVTVLCCPYLLAVYVLYGISLVIKKILEITGVVGDNCTSSIFKGRVFIFFSLGAAALALIFFIFVFSRMEIGELLPNIKIMLINPEYPNQSIGFKLGYYIWQLQTCHKFFPYILIAYGVILVTMLIDRKRDEHKLVYYLASGCLTILCYVLFIPMLTGLYFNGLGMPLIFVGLTAYIFCKEKPVDIFYSIFIIGILYSLCANFSSNTGIFAIEQALSLSGFASFIFIGQFLSEGFSSKRQRYISVVLTIIVIAFLAILQFRVKTEYYYKEYESGGGKEWLTYEMEGGPADGITTSYAIHAEYQMMLWDVNEFIMNHQSNDKLLILSERPWLYLMFDHYSYATFSAWIPAENDATLRRLHKYYEVNPDKIPKYVYIPKKSNWHMDGIFEDAQKYGYRVDETKYSWQLTKENNE